MRVFLSWSGDESEQVALALRRWLPRVIQSIKPWMSKADIHKGARWSKEIAAELKDTQVGIICLTPQNLEAPWLLFESGALSKVEEQAYVCTYLFGGVDRSQMKGPLVQFQDTTADKEDTRKLIQTINSLVSVEPTGSAPRNTEASAKLASGRLNENELNEAFDVWWPTLERDFKAIVLQPPVLPGRTERELLEETLELVRLMSRDTLRAKQAQTSTLDPDKLLDPYERARIENIDYAEKKMRALGRP